MKFFYHKNAEFSFGEIFQEKYLVEVKQARQLKTKTEYAGHFGLPNETTI